MMMMMMTRQIGQARAGCQVPGDDGDAGGDVMAHEARYDDDPDGLVEA